jgi:hypothetical protein
MHTTFFYFFGYECIYVACIQTKISVITQILERGGGLWWKQRRNYEFTFISFTNAIVNALGLVVMIQQNAIS